MKKEEALKITTELYQYLRATDEEFNEQLKAISEDSKSSADLKKQVESDKLEILYEIGSY